MNRLMPISALTLLLVWAALVCSACTGRTYLIVDYQVPAATQQLSGQSVRLEISDQRKNPRILAAAAGYHFRDFRDLYSLAWIMPDNERVLAGEQNLEQLIGETFEKRLQQMGAVIGNASQTDLPVLTITLQQLRIDLQDRKWSAELKYEASLTRDGERVVKERVHGNAERVRVVGRKGADTVLSDIFTDAVNRLDLYKLFQRAKLIS